MNLYRKRPVTVEVMQWTGYNEAELRKWTGDAVFYRLDEDEITDDLDHTAALYVAANSVWVGMPTDDWVIKDSAGFYPCKDDIFKASYEPLVNHVS